MIEAIIFLSISLVILILSNIITIIALRIQLKNVKTYEKVISEDSKVIEKFEEWLLESKRMSARTFLKLKEVDNKNLFNKDDDVGFIFAELLQITNEFNKWIQYYFYEEKTKTDKT